MLTPLHIREYGNPDGEPLLAIHGVSAHAERWERLALEALPHRRTIAVDLRGHGFSSWSPPWSIEAQVRDVIGTLDVLGLTGPLDVVGHSYGGAIALRLLAAQPDRVRRLVLLDPALAANPTEMAALAEQALAFGGFTTIEDATVARNAGLGDTIHPSVTVDVEQHLVHGGDGRYRFRFLPLAVATSYGELCHPIPVVPARPTLVVQAAKAPWVTVDVLDRLRALLGDHLTVVPLDSGHMVYWERFAETADAVTDFLS